MPPPELEAALEQLDLRDWLQQYCKIQSAGRDEIQLHTCCKCDNDKYKLYVNVSRKVWYCHRCQYRGNDPSVLMAEVSGRSLQDVRLELLRMVLPSVPGETYNAALNARLSDFNAWDAEDDLSDLILPTELPGNVDFSSRTGTQVMKYACSRGLTSDLVDCFQLRASMTLRSHTGPFLVFPVRFAGMPVAWQGRRTGAGHPKYVSSDNIANWLWPCNEAYLHRLREQGSVVLTEGVFDAIGCMLAGIDAVACFGKNLTAPQQKILQDCGVETVYLGFDCGTYRDVVKAVDSLNPAFNVKIMELQVSQQGGKVDMGDAVLDRNLLPVIWEAYCTAIEAPGSDYFAWRLAKELK